MARVLVTGGCGFIGSHLVASLLARGDEVCVLDDLSSGDASRIGGAWLKTGSVADRAMVAAAMDGVDAVVHLAAIASVEQCTRDWASSSRVNLGGTVEVLLAAAERAIPVVFASSAAIYGDQARQPIDEGAPPAPLSAYGADKLGGELHAAAMSATRGLRAAALRFFNVYGAGQNPSSPYSGVISIFAESLRRGDVLTIYGDGGATRDFVAVADVVAALVAATDAMSAMDPNQGAFFVRNVCTGTATSVAALADAMAMAAGVRQDATYAPARAGEIRHSLGDPTALRAWLDLPPPVTLAEGLKALTTVAFHPQGAG